LHWLPIRSRIHFKLALITYKALSSSEPTYLASLLHPYTSGHSGLRSGDQNLLHKPPNNTNFGSRAFRHAAPLVWNAIPLQVRSSSSISSFKRNLKTHYFSHPPS
jgi:hypothetical protein